jgi:CBS domain-containing protein
MTIAGILKSKGSEVATVAPTMTVKAVVELLRTKRIGAVLVLGSGQEVLGVVSERDVVRGLAVNGASVLDQTADQIMSAPVVTCAPGDTVQEAMEQMTAGRFRHLPVMDGGRLLGIVSIGDLVKRRIEDAEHEAEELKQYITTG